MEITAFERERERERESSRLGCSEKRKEERESEVYNFMRRWRVRKWVFVKGCVRVESFYYYLFFNFINAVKCFYWV
jgi:hypothetical protein